MKRSVCLHGTGLHLRRVSHRWKKPEKAEEYAEKRQNRVINLLYYQLGMLARRNLSELARSIWKRQMASGRWTHVNCALPMALALALINQAKFIQDPEDAKTGTFPSRLRDI